jgi:hypothetical protein
VHAPRSPRFIPSLRRHVPIDFTEAESGIFEGLRQDEGIYILQNLSAARSLAKSMDQMIGDWAMVRDPLIMLRQ